ncbi:S-Ena type endospore appendage [Terrisporobacter vanillatitrophus]|uniref:S-Ena type endospore appendage n=1 Tax=Terrisporobacter vanillatitrophus TaxID=3058402 RepID=UPI0033695EA7
MYEMNKKCCCGWDTEPECDYRRNDCDDKRKDCDDKRKDCDDKKIDCDIKSECCEGFVREQFSIRTTATSGTGREVYRNSANLLVTGTVMLTNLGQRDITFVVDGLQEIVPPNETAALTATNIDHVTISTQNGTARALLCFDIQVPSPA